MRCFSFQKNTTNISPVNRNDRPGRCYSVVTLYFLYLRCLQALRPLLDLELHLVALIQGFVTIADDRLEMDEHILAVLSRNEPVPLGSIEPLHGTLFH